LNLELITLLTDFGTADYFVGAMKGAILTVNPHARIIDITHEIAPQDIQAGAFTLLGVYQAFPPQTIHVAVVDPGVGSERRPLAVAANNHLFIGPDNGLFSYIYDSAATCRVFHLTNEKYFRQTVSGSFHGRDVFAPVAAAISLGVKPDSVGSLVTDYRRLDSLAPNSREAGLIEATIIHVDRFGNCITNLTREDLNELMISQGAFLMVGEHEIRSFRRYFAEADRGSDPVFAIWGSAGFLEISAFRSSAAQLLGVTRGAKVLVTGFN
jgi:S-adenosyl-L-methionine hydrolase (adenosine-forming)